MIDSLFENNLFRIILTFTLKNPSTYFLSDPQNTSLGHYIVSLHTVIIHCLAVVFMGETKVDFLSCLDTCEIKS